MLNGIDPIFLFNFFKLTGNNRLAISRAVPILSTQFLNFIELPPIPLYLSENLTGIFLDSESKNIDIETVMETKKDGSDPDINQKGLGSVVTINMLGNKDSIGLSLISALADFCLKKVSSKEYSITYLHGATTIFNGLLHQFSVNSNANDSKLMIQVQLSYNSKTTPGAEIPVVGRLTGTLPGATL